VAAARGTRPPALHPDRRRARWRGQTEVAVHPSWVGGFPRREGQSSLTKPGSSGALAGAPRDPPGLPRTTEPLGWQPSRFLVDRAEAERAFQLAEQLGSVNAAAAELGTTWPSLRKAFTRHGLGMPAPNPEAVRQRVIATARQRSGQPTTPSLDPAFVALNPGALPARPRSPAELHQWVRRDEEYATLGANVVVELYSESHARQPTTRAWAIIRRADRAHRLAGQRASRPERRQAERADRPDRSQQARSRRWRPMLANLHLPDRPGQRAAVPPRRRWIMSRLRTVPVPALPIRGLRVDQAWAAAPPVVVPARRRPLRAVP
jgi:hypothetical protein